MRIDFFEEFPDDESLSKAKYLTFSSQVFIAAHSVKEFLAHKQKLESINPIAQAGYWPILKDSYWISALAERTEIDTLRIDLEDHSNDLNGVGILLDLELPFRKPELFRKNIFSFLGTKQAVRSLFLSANNIGMNISTAEYPIPFWLGQWGLRVLGVQYPQSLVRHERVITIYTSILTGWDRSRRLERVLKWYFGRVAKKYSLQFGLGLTSGVFGATAVLSPEELRSDLDFVRRSGSQRAVIFRFNGLDSSMAQLLKEFMNDMEKSP